MIHFYLRNSADFLREKANGIEESALHDSSVPKEIYSRISLRAFFLHADRQQAARRKDMLFLRLSNRRKIKGFLRHGLKFCQHSAENLKYK